MLGTIYNVYDAVSSKVVSFVQSKETQEFGVLMLNIIIATAALNGMKYGIKRLTTKK